MRRHEPKLLGDLKSELAAANEKRRCAEELLAEARGEEWRAHRRGQWVQQTADDDVMRRQPVTSATRAPDNFAPPPGSLARPWHKRREGAGEAEEAAA
jgi:hypothetical protein